MNTAVAVFFGLCAVGAGCYGLVVLLTRLAFAARAETTTGEVVSQKAVGTTSSAMRTESGMSYQPIVRFVDRHGRSVDFRSTVGYSPPRHRPGQEVTIRYDPRRPDHAIILGDATLAWPAGFLALGAFFGLVSVVSFLVP